MRVAAVVLTLLLVAASCSDDDAADGADPTSTTTEPAAAVFVWDDDNLHDWVTDEEMANAIADLEPEYSGAELEAEAVDDRREYSWLVRIPGQAQGWFVDAHRVDGLTDWETDPRLPSGVTYAPTSGGYALSGPHSDESVGLVVHPPAGVSIPEDDRVFTVGSMMLVEMGWAE